VRGLGPLRVKEHAWRGAAAAAAAAAASWTTRQRGAPAAAGLGSMGRVACALFRPGQCKPDGCDGVTLGEKTKACPPRVRHGRIGQGAGASADDDDAGGRAPPRSARKTCSQGPSRPAICMWSIHHARFLGSPSPRKQRWRVPLDERLPGGALCDSRRDTMDGAPSRGIFTCLLMTFELPVPGYQLVMLGRGGHVSRSPAP
jgi:hypothetical protein